MTAIGVGVLATCGDRCSQKGGFAGGPSAHELAAISFVAGGLAAAGFVVLLLAPRRVHVTYPNGERPLPPPEE
jgi:hypothetical protein